MSTPPKDNKERLQIMERSCNDLIEYIDFVNKHGGVKAISDLYEHAICDCVNRLGDSVKVKELDFDAAVQKEWTGLRVITAHLYHKLDLSKVWTELPVETQKLLAIIKAKLK